MNGESQQATISLAGYGPSSREVRPYVEAARSEIAAIGRAPEWASWWSRCEASGLPLYFVLFFASKRRRISVKRTRYAVEACIDLPLSTLPGDPAVCAELARADVREALRVVATKFEVGIPESTVGRDASDVPSMTQPTAEDDNTLGEIKLRLPLDAMSSSRADDLVDGLVDALDGIADVDDFEEEGDEWVMPLVGDLDAILTTLRALAARPRSPLARAHLLVPGADVRAAPRVVPIVPGP